MEIPEVWCSIKKVFEVKQAIRVVKVVESHYSPVQTSLQSCLNRAIPHSPQSLQIPK
jgi:hypothetical protein